MSRFDEKWVEYSCADCDPTLPGFENEESEWDKAYIILVPEGTDAPDRCPRCGSYLGFCEGAKELQITNTPEERWASRKVG